MWSQQVAQKRVNEYGKNPDLDVALTYHAKKQMHERGILLADVRYTLTHGHIDAPPAEATKPDHYKYKICGKTPNSGSRDICLIVIPNPNRPAVKIITVMWKDL